MYLVSKSLFIRLNFFLKLYYLKLAENYGIQAVVCYWSSSTDLHMVEPGEFCTINAFYIQQNFILGEKYLNMEYFCQKECKRLSWTLLFKVRSTNQQDRFTQELVRNV